MYSLDDRVLGPGSYLAGLSKVQHEGERHRRVITRHVASDMLVGAMTHLERLLEPVGIWPESLILSRSEHDM